MSSSDISRRDLVKVAGALSAVGASSVACVAAAEAVGDGQPTPLLDELDRISDVERLPRILQLMRGNALPFFDEMRRARPVMKVGDVTLVARYADVVEVLSHPTTFTVKFYKPKMGDFMLTHDATPTHARDKAVMTAMLPQADGAHVRRLVGGYASDAIAASNGRLELVNGFGRAIPLRLVQEYFGLDGIDLAELKRWSYWSQLDNFHNHPFQARPDADEISHRAAREKQDLVAYCTALVARRSEELQTDPDKDDIVSRMLRTKLPDSVGFGLDRVVLNSVGLLIGAVETTSHAVVHAIDELLRRPAALAQAADAARQDDFDKLAQLVWEGNRFKPISPYMFRLCEQEFTIAKGTDRETTILPGTVVFALTQSAMFDPLEFEAPNEFLADRPDYQSFLFGFGHHRCLGEHVARQMIPEAVRGLVLRPNLRRTSGAEGEINYQNGPFPESMYVEFDV